MLLIRQLLVGEMLGSLRVLYIGRIYLGKADAIGLLREAKGKLVKGLGANNRRGNHAVVGINAILCDLQDTLRLVVQLRADMPSGVVVSLIEVQHSVQVDVSLACLLHQVAHKACRLGGVVDVEHQVTDAIDDDQAHVGGVVDGMADNLSALIRGSDGSEVAEFQLLGFSVEWQPRQPKNALHHQLAVVRALLGVEVKDITLALGKARPIFQYLSISEGRGYQGTHIESLLRLGFPCRDAEVAERANDGIVHTQHNRR